VIHKFERLAADPRFRYFGNIRVGRDISVAELRDMYDAVVLAYGAEYDRRLGIAGETLPGVLSARDFVGWYNGLPDCQSLNESITKYLQQTEDVAIFGVGNVALDVARILLMPVDELAKTDITEAAVQALRQSCVRRVHLIARRGPLQVSCLNTHI
jgi:adrenodoxin-NADP+ reductase